MSSTQTDSPTSEKQQSTEVMDADTIDERFPPGTIRLERRTSARTHDCLTTL